MCATTSKVSCIAPFDIGSKDADKSFETTTKRRPGRPAKRKGSDMCLTPTTALCDSKTEISQTNADQVIEPAKKRGRGRPKKPQGNFVTCVVMRFLYTSITY